MNGHVLWLDGFYIKAIEDILNKSNKKKVSIEDVKESLKDIENQAKFTEQIKIIKRMKDCGIEDERICKIFGYDKLFLDELLSLDKNSEYDYSQFKRLNL